MLLFVFKYVVLYFLVCDICTSTISRQIIQLIFRQFIFEVNRIIIYGEILKKLCAGHHVSEADSRYISEQPSPFFQFFKYWSTIPFTAKVTEKKNLVHTICAKNYLLV